MIIDGRAIAKEILDEVATGAAQATPAPHLSIITSTPNFETQKYLALKKRKAAEVGIRTSLIELPADCSTDDVVQTVAAATGQSDGVVVQLPLPDQVDINKVFASMPTTHDVDAIHYDGESGPLPPVVGAIAEIAARHDVSFKDKKVTIVGAGRLVGAPSLLWVSNKGAEVTLITRETPDQESAAAIANADIIIAGAGVPNLITPDKIKAGVLIFDAGTSEEGGVLAGDVDPAVASKAALFTPVPGGIGPITIACLLQNLVIIAQARQ